MFFGNFEDAAVVDSTSRVHVLDLNPWMANFPWSLSRTNPPWSWRDTLSAPSTIFMHRGSRYVRASGSAKEYMADFPILRLSRRAII